MAQVKTFWDFGTFENIDNFLFKSIIGTYLSKLGEPSFKETGMKKTTFIILALCLIFSGSFCFAAKDGEKGASDQAYEHASDNSVFNRTSDWFATIGKSDEEKQKVLTERKARRAAKKAQEQTGKQARKAEKQLMKEEKKAGKKAQKVQTQEREEMRNREQKRLEVLPGHHEGMERREPVQMNSGKKK